MREPQQIELERLTLRMPNTRGRLPEGGLRILHLSDTHFRGADWREKPKIDRVLRKCQSEQYDLIVHTGDFLHDDGGLQNTLELLDQLPKPTIAKYAVFGNHDYTTYSAREMFSRSWDSFNRLEAEQCPNGTGNNPARQAERLLRFWLYFANAPLDLRRTGHNDT
ncbi:MAG: metallophosphoesterase, partial [Oricola sp.]|nr:metallophosphoesterase [Oricola sp.]